MGNKCDRLMSQYLLRSQSCVSSESKDMDENTTNTEIRKADALLVRGVNMTTLLVAIMSCLFY